MPEQRSFFLRWGGKTLISLWISILSGLVLGLQYRVVEPFYSTVTIELLVPFGSFWRSLHYYSSQAFFLLLLMHLLVSIWENRVRFSSAAWLRLSTVVPVAGLLLFTGYILRGDATGEAAGAIAENIMLSIPLLGKPLNKIFFDISSSGLNKVYLHHSLGFLVLGVLALWPHLRRYPVSWYQHLPLLLLLLLGALHLKTPIEPDRFGLVHIAGPWFLMGMQEMLRYLPTFWAGVFIPALPLLAVAFLPPEGRPRLASLLFLVVWLLTYALLSYLSLTRFSV
jgi:ubiquinol-cytochrome c reductase cytochrome b subunit